MRSKRNVLILYNAQAGSQSRTHQVRQLEAALEARALRPECVGDLDRFGDLAARAFERNDLAAVIAAGGDGTAAEVVSRTPPGIPLATFPLGTENLLSRYLGHSRDPEEVAKLITIGNTITLDGCRAGKRLFLIMISVGFDAEVVRQLAKIRQGHISKMSYIQPLIATLRSYTYPEFQVYCGNGSPLSASPSIREPNWPRWLFGMNLPLYAMNLPFAPKADGTDGQLDVCTFDRGSTLHFARYFYHLMVRDHLQLPDVHWQRCQWMRIETNSDVPVPYQIDGDPGGFLPVDVVVEPNRYQAVISAKRAQAIRGRIAYGI
ncbi:MAG: NAD(+)/NADH kinase [Pirellulales bacterium]|nr:NAD(+)/NADH kinase [Pirellulales bacterium]